ncbi:MAG: hypothetical protein Q4A34_02825 [Candidatus Saccharibacteria bacterium]|nr:hypothetical protein [Candidatus Saccharibacteria bacterium]
MQQTFVIINGRAYDAATGLPLHLSPEELAQATAQPSQSPDRGTTTTSLHRRAQKSATLSRRHLKQRAKKPLATRPARRMVSDITTHAAVRKFATTAPAPIKNDTPVDQATRITKPATKAGRPTSTARTQRLKRKTTLAHRSTTQATEATPPAKARHAPLQSAKALKQSAIAEALAKEVKPQTPRRLKKQRRGFRRWISVGSAGFAIMLLGAYFTYLSMPNISIRVAALQSGVNATYPSYRPSGYALRGPISFKQGEVSMRFAYAGGGAGYTITQTKSDWDSAAVKQQITKEAGAPVTTTIDGLTIFSNDNGATWVNGGILYHIKSDAPLSSEHIRKIATSL